MGIRPGAEILTIDEVDYSTALGVKDFNVSSDVYIRRGSYSQHGCGVRERVKDAFEG